MLYEQKEIKKLSELLELLSTHITQPENPVWYRGHGDKTFELKPVIYRNGRTKKEIDYLKQFKQDAISLVEPRPEAGYEWLFLMRHYGLPTRLLDWTESPLIATFFAVNDAKTRDKDGALWVILPLELNRNITEFRNSTTLPSFDEDSLESYTPDQFDKSNPQNAMLPIAFLALRNSPRMRAQSSVFTIHHYDRIAIDEVGNGNHIWKYIIPQTAKENIRKELKLLGMNIFQIYPELERLKEKIEEI